MSTLLLRRDLLRLVSTVTTNLRIAINEYIIATKLLIAISVYIIATKLIIAISNYSCYKFAHWDQ